MRWPHFFLLLLGLVSAVMAAPETAIWPDQASDLPPDPAVRRGLLPNGLRYAIRPNAEPKDRVSLRLLVAAGSLHERDDERGLAHFVEHMAFRGTRQHPNGSMATKLQRRGIAFGPDNTAFTHHHYTIYHLELPDTGEETLQLGLSVFREYAQDITFAPELIERERSVILSEKNIRDTPDARAGEANLAFLWPDSRRTRRSPIGTEESIRQLSRDQFVSFYDAWYRPERMAVVVVGNVDPERVEKLIIDALSPLSSRGPAREDAIELEPSTASAPSISIFSDPGLIGASCVLQHPFRESRAPDTHARRVAQLHRALAFTMLERRAVKAADRTEGLPIAPSARINEGLPNWSIAGFGGTGRITDWETFMASLEQEHRRAFLHGFTAEELRLAKLSFVTSYEDAVRTAATWPSGWIANRLSESLIEGARFTTPSIVQADIAPDLDAATAEQCLAAFRATWTTRPPHVFITTHPAFEVSAQQVAAALNVSRSQPVARPEETSAVTFAYTHFGSTGQLQLENHVADLDVHQGEFVNGVRLNFKATPFEADTVQICVRIGSGRLSQPATQPGLDLLANQLVARGGLGRHDFEELQDLLNGHRIRVGFLVQSDALEFTARCAPADLLLCLQVITAHLTDSAFRPEAMRHVQANFGSLFAGLAADAAGPINMQAGRVLASGDGRFGLPSPDELSARTISELKAWLQPQFTAGPIELSIVGETSWPAATAAVASSLGSLPPRSPAAALRNPLKIAKPRKSGYIYTTAPQLRQVALAWFCPVPDLTDIRQERRCVLLAELLEERMRVRLREELGASYACSAHFRNHEGFPQLSYFALFAEVDPSHAQAATQAMRDELEQLRKKRFTDDEFERVKAPFLRSREEDLRSNGYWGHTVLRDAQLRPERIAAARDRATDTESITRTELEVLASRYLKPADAFQFVSYPRAEGSP